MADLKGGTTLSPSELEVIIALERTGASLSLIAVFLIFIIWGLFRRLRTIPNIFIVFASIANVGASVACLIGYDGLEAGAGTALCQAQAFLLEMFMQSDPWWSAAMAVNVFLVFFYGASPASFRRYLWLYCIICFGGPFIPAIVLLLYQPDGRPMYGDATLWCWIEHRYTALRIYTYYLPIWICIFLSVVIYFAIGYHVFRQRNQLRAMTFSHTPRTQDGKSSWRHDENDRDSAEKDLSAPTRFEDWQVTAVTEVQITTADTAPISEPESPILPQQQQADIAQPARTHRARHQDPWPLSDEEPDPLPYSSTRPSPATGAAAAIPHPSAPHRFETMITSSPPPPGPKPPVTQRVRSIRSRVRARLRALDPVKLAYLRTSFIFAISILVTWTPSSINRINDLLHPGNVSYGLNVATAVVLPLQGVWNAVIFFITSWGTVREEFHGMRARRRRHARRLDSRGVGRGFEEVGEGCWRGGGRGGAGLERGKGDGTSEVELTAPPVIRNDNVRALRGSFS